MIPPPEGGDGWQSGYVNYSSPATTMQRGNSIRSCTRRARQTRRPTTWAAGQRCIVPANWFVEPNWSSGRHVPWKFERADGQPWALAGIWSEWIHPETGEVVPSYSVLTQNCDAHPLLRQMHKPDPALGPDEQDKRAVVPIEEADWDAWLHASVQEAQRLIRLPAEDLVRHGPAKAHSETPSLF